MSDNSSQKSKYSNRGNNSDSSKSRTVSGPGSAKGSEEKVENKRAISFGDISNTHLIIVIFIIFSAYLIFYPESSFVQCFKTSNKIKETKQNIKAKKLEIKQDCVIINGLQNDKEYLMKYVREHLYFSNKGETIYIIEEKAE